MAITYEQLSLSGKPHRVKTAWLGIIVRDLTPGDFYVMPFKLWASSGRPVRIEIYRGIPTKPTDPVFSRSFSVGPDGDERDPNSWESRRYRLDDERHDGSAYVRLGWAQDSKLFSGGTDFWVFAEPLTSKKIRKKQRRDSGLCPECGLPGEWRAMAMVCDEHGVFLG